MPALSTSTLPSNNFYEKFYSEFSKTYSSLSELDPQWIQLKLTAANWLITQLGVRKEQRTLSIGVGLGILENHIIKNIDIDLHVHEVSDTVIQYFDDDFPADHIHIGNYPDCIPGSLKFDTIIMGGIEYIFDEDALENFISKIHEQLNPGGKLLIISWSFYERSALSKAKYLLKECLVKSKFYRKGLQFWGFLRTEEELKHTAEKVGFELQSSQKDYSVGNWNTLFLSFIKKMDV
jgi:cyclopropane fatty-acyl-phospholipid synthase-like methyltransferase